MRRRYLRSLNLRRSFIGSMACGRKSPHRRRFRKRSKAILLRLGDFLALPPVKPILLLAVSLCLLLVLTPYLLTRVLPGIDDAKDKASPDASFELVVVPDDIQVYRTETKKTETIDFEDYVKGVVSGEMPSSFHPEALKAQAVAARTYSLARVLKAEDGGNPEAHPDAPLCDSTHCQVYRSERELEALKGDSWMKDGWEKICQAVDDTEGELLYYDGQLVAQALFHSSSGGKTENSEDVFASAVPYLVSVESPYEEEATHKNEKNTFSISDFSKAIKAKYANISFGEINASNIKIISRSSGGRVEKMQIGGGIIEGRNVREALELPSANFDISISGDTITFTSSGSGHGVGMSQYGANGMAKKGYDYKKILSHYYSGTEVY
ncbi:MAG: stage II sporulation protein D [Bacillota bacterium]|nr:stage II sporulation protein D [Bacillota bacterium]